MQGRRTGTRREFFSGMGCSSGWRRPTRNTGSQSVSQCRQAGRQWQQKLWPRGQPVPLPAQPALPCTRASCQPPRAAACPASDDQWQWLARVWVPLLLELCDLSSRLLEVDSAALW